MDEVNNYTNEDRLFSDDVEYLKGCIKPNRNIEYLYSEKRKYHIDIKIKPHEIVNVTIETDLIGFMDLKIV